MRKYRIVVQKTSYAVMDIQIYEPSSTAYEDAQAEALRQAYVEQIWPEEQVNILLTEEVV